MANVRFVSNGTNELPRRWQGKRFGQLHGGIDPHPIGNDHNINLGTSKDIELHYIFSKIFHNLDCLKLSAVIYLTSNLSLLLPMFPSIEISHRSLPTNYHNRSHSCRCSTFLGLADTVES